MNCMQHTTGRAVIGMIVGLLSAASGAFAQTISFEVTPLPLPLACDASLPRAINDAGQVVLVCQLSGGGQTRSFQWANGEIQRIGEFGTGFLRHEASDLNDSGQIAGSSWVGGFPAAAWSWEGGSFTPLGTLGGANAASFAINEDGLQTGWANVGLPQSVFSFYAYVAGGASMTNLGELPEAAWSCGDQINAAGRVVGVSETTGGRFPRAFLADTTMGMHSLGTLGGLESNANDINDANQIVGRSSTVPIVDNWWAFHAFLWQEGVMIDLGTLPGDEYSSASAINAAGTVVGWSQPGFFGSQSRAVLWRRHEVVDLNALIPAGSGWVLTSAADINAAGQIIGTGQFKSQSRPFILTPLL